MTEADPLSGHTAAPAGALDRYMLERMCEALGDESGDFITGIVAVYESEAIGLVEQLNDAAQDADVQRLGFAAHSLKGSSASVGGNRLAGLCAELEHWEGAPDDLLPRVAVVKTELAALLGELRVLVQR